VIPNCVSYDPTFAFELAVIIHDGLRRMVANQEDVFYYVTVMNENYTHPGLADVADRNAEQGILKGMYLLKEGGKHKLRVQLMGSGTILREVIAAAELLERDWGIGADIWSCPSFTELRRDGLDADRWNMLHPTAKPRKSYVETRLEGRAGPVVASTDYMKAFADQIRPFIPGGMRYRVLGTDGFGRSDTRERLRYFFEVNRYWVTIAALKALAEDGAVKPALVAEAIEKYRIDPGKPNPVTV
jgi:pyruvate dehydrogenase E1 component